MIYQRHIPPKELFSAQLEMLMRNGRLATVLVHLIGVMATIGMFWPFLDLVTIVLWALAFMVLLVVRSLHMRNALAERRFNSAPKALFWPLVLSDS